MLALETATSRNIRGEMLPSTAIISVFCNTRTDAKASTSRIILHSRSGIVPFVRLHLIAAAPILYVVYDAEAIAGVSPV